MSGSDENIDPRLAAGILAAGLIVGVCLFQFWYSPMSVDTPVITSIPQGSSSQPVISPSGNLSPTGNEEGLAIAGAEFSPPDAGRV